jgi:hypothetical protein
MTAVSSVTPLARLRVERSTAASCLVEESLESGGFDEIQHVADVIVGNGRRTEQRLAMGAAMPSPGAKLKSGSKERQAPPAEGRKRRHADTGHRRMQILALPLVREAGAGLSIGSKQIRRTKLESDMDSARYTNRKETL